MKSSTRISISISEFFGVLLMKDEDRRRNAIEHILQAVEDVEKPTFKPDHHIHGGSEAMAIIRRIAKKHTSLLRRREKARARLEAKAQRQEEARLEAATFGASIPTIFAAPAVEVAAPIADETAKADASVADAVAGKVEILQKPAAESVAEPIIESPYEDFVYNFAPNDEHRVRYIHNRCDEFRGNMMRFMRLVWEQTKSPTILAIRQALEVMLSFAQQLNAEVNYMNNCFAGTRPPRPVHVRLRRLSPLESFDFPTGTVSLRG